ncbi:MULTISPECIES: phosphate ABC transporter permease PstA [Vibrio]|uniref:phosphate ABC transporter permease PstA n=1 Tax=Vibrio TaxID=662 RepID=UPI0001B947F2|nr:MULTISPECIES: phosphate ABC transporter permease PstA [Vibrio]MCM5509885.1 phosphate ABC transporter permease PstA [Vibrio sp. SCSIO 43169]EEX34143.1 phosphate transport system permease protein PstA [Vibrio coralliilyticus ATCC BAA-450]MDE3899836.1 phosphate ABC transporter permease PstA [Vibrio sp. CC007]QFT35470.1 Phosphate transport system permease protein PstA [Vibrio sp. THAF64]QGM33369.1 Phosphate transport system permease protein PstA [Vibrio sp. THAF191d]
MFKWLKSGSPWVWLTGGAVSISLLSVLGLLLLIGWKGLSYFWPAPLYQWKTEQGDVLIGQLYAEEYVPISHLREMDIALTPEVEEKGLVQRLSIKIANRDIYPADFVSILEVDLLERSKPEGWAVIERTRGGDFYGQPKGYFTADGKVSEQAKTDVESALVFADKQRTKIDRLVEKQIKVISAQADRLRLEKKRRELNGRLDAEFIKRYDAQSSMFSLQLAEMESQLDALRLELEQQGLIVEDMKGNQYRIPLSRILDVWYPNQMTIVEKVAQWAHQAWKFLSDDPRESNSEGGVFPAMFGTVLLVLIMSIIVMPLGVIAAIYLHEYAKNNAFTRLIRVAVINLAGVPSIVYGVFGLGFFVYTLGGSIDSLFYAEKLPTPTFGTPGLLWSALTLAVLTLPVVIVATEEGLTRIPSSVRHGSLALGATQFETMWRIVLPMASPAIITGLILAVARAAGEVAPLMLVGAVKLASSLPVDSQFPFLHLDRKFMHLGFHIYDVGFQTTNIESARPLVYATSFLLVSVIVGLNLTAISIRNNLREKYRTLGQD